MPKERWRTWEPILPAPGAFAMRVVSRLDACSPDARRLVEAAAVLGGTVSLSAAGVLADVQKPVEALDEAVDLNLLQVREDFAIRDVAFSHPLVQAAVYEQLGPARRVQLHSVAAGLVDDEASALRHRVMAVTPPDPELVADLDAFARREAAVGAWAGAAWALVEASRLSPDRAHREQRLLRAVDAMVGAGDLIQAEAFAREAVVFAPGPLRNAALGYLAVLRGDRHRGRAAAAGGMGTLRQHRRRVDACSCRATTGAARTRSPPRRGDGRLGAARRWSWLRRVTRSGWRRRRCGASVSDGRDG